MCCRHEPQVMSCASCHAASIRTSQTGVQIKVKYRSRPKCITDHNGNEANDARAAKRVQHSAARMALGQLWTDRAIKVVDRSAIQRSDRGAISDHTTVIHCLRLSSACQYRKSFCWNLAPSCTVDLLALPIACTSRSCYLSYHLGV